MGEVMIVHGPGIARDLLADAVDPRAAVQARVVGPCQFRQVFGARQFAGDQRAAVIRSAIALQAPGDDFCRRDAPLGETLEILPFGLDPWAPQITTQTLAGRDVALDVVVHATAFDADDFGEWITGQALAFEGEHRVEGTEVFRQRGVARLQLPARHQSASP